MLLQVVLHRCHLNLRFPSVAQSIAPLLSQLNRIEAERQVQWERKLVEFHTAYSRYIRGKTVGQPASMEEAWRRVSAGLVVIFDGEFFPRLEQDVCLPTINGSLDRRRDGRSVTKSS